MTFSGDTYSDPIHQKRLDIVEARRLHRIGLSIDYIAWDLGVTRHTIKKWLFRPFPPRRLRDVA